MRSAARALEAIWGVPKAIRRVLERAAAGGTAPDREEWGAYGRALQWMRGRTEVIQTLQDEWSSGRIELQARTGSEK